VPIALHRYRDRIGHVGPGTTTTPHRPSVCP
jgi:hypothetical protein